MESGDIFAGYAASHTRVSIINEGNEYSKTMCNLPAWLSFLSFVFKR
jgi:hypothetical protein